MSWRKRISIVSLAFGTYLAINKDIIQDTFFKKPQIPAQIVIQENITKIDSHDNVQNVQIKQGQQKESSNQQIDDKDKKQKENSDQSKEQQKKQEPQQQKQQQKEQDINRYLKRFPEYNLDSQNNDKFVLIVADVPYTTKFQQILMGKIADILKQRKSQEPLKIYRMNLKQHKKILEQKNNITLKEDTILMMKNPYDDKFINIDFDMFIDNPKVLPVFLSQSHFINQKSYKAQYMNSLRDISSTQACLFFVVNPNSQEQVQKELLTTKYIQMQLALNNIENVNVFAIDVETMKKCQLMENPKPNSLHLIRKSNQYTVGTPNRWLFDQIPYHFIQNVSLSDKKGQILIKKYLSRVQIFNSSNVQAPYILNLIIDKNSIDPFEYKQILQTFAAIKESKRYSGVSFVLTFGKIQFTGKQQQLIQNKRWMIKIINIEEIQTQLMGLQVKKQQEIKQLGLDEKKFAKNTFQYLYKQPEVSSDLVSSFIERVINREEKDFYKTQKKEKLQKTNKLTGGNFHKNIFEDETQSHLVFEYSDYCAACKVLSPLMDQFSQICKSMPILKLKVHSLNCERNRVKGQPYSPYTPNVYYYSQNWKNKRPIGFPIMYYYNNTGIMGLYNFIEITQSLEKMSLKRFQEMIENTKSNEIKISDF